MEDELLDAVVDRLIDSGADDTTASLVIAGCLGESELREALEGAPTRPSLQKQQRSSADHEPVTAYLRSVSVAGFRGIGPTATLSVEPGVGLTVVCGRNGSGKSSFAEALEVLLTGNLRRFEWRSAVWREGWRCLHGGEPKIQAEFLVAGQSSPVAVRREWTETAKLADGTPAGLEPLGWDEALRSYRPFLSHSELESMLGEPKALHDQLNDILGLDELVAAGSRMAALRLDVDKRSKAPKEALPPLRAALEGLGADERAIRSIGALGKSPDIDALELIAAGAAPVTSGPIAALEAAAAVRGPDPEDLTALIESLTVAAEDLERASDGGAVDAARLADLLDAALAHYERHGSGDCPVCKAPGQLDTQWRDTTIATVIRLRSQAAAYLGASAAAQRAIDAARTSMAPIPRALETPDLSVDAADVLAAWQLWLTAPEAEPTPTGLRAWAAHLAETGPPLGDAVAEFSAHVEADTRRHQDLWAPVAAQLAAWCQLARQGQDAVTTVNALKRAEQWLKQANDAIRNERLRPFQDKALALWSQLRSESNVDLAGIRLAGSSTQSHVDFEVTVDGAPAQALGVMSQGEVNALALSVFLPRATMPGSPFGFLIIDDPVQAMDPSKVDGMARVLTEVATDRQVVVFTHDDRLPNAIRRLGLPARIIGVTRRPGSVVELHSASDPCSRILRDARAMTRGQGVPVAVARRVLPGLCRTAIEAVLLDTIRRRGLARGESHEDIDAAIDSAERTTQKAALAIYANAERGGDVLTWLRDEIGPWAASTFQTCNRGAHGGTDFDAARLVGLVGDLCDKLQERLGDRP